MAAAAKKIVSIVTNPWYTPGVYHGFLVYNKAD